MKYREGYKYQLEEAIFVGTEVRPPEDIETPWIRLNTIGILRLAPGYAWDGPTGAIDTKNSMKASAAHDALCQLVQCGLLSRSWKYEADQTYVKICVIAGMSRARAFMHGFIISMHNWTKTPEKPVIEIK